MTAIQHGTWGGYKRCHCAECRAVPTRYRRKVRRLGRPATVRCQLCDEMFLDRRTVAIHETKMHSARLEVA